MATTKLKMTTTGQQVVATRLNRLEGAVPKFLTDATRAEWGIEFAEMKRIVPYKTGALHDSGTLVVRGSRSLMFGGGQGAEAQITFGDPAQGINYAVVQHEDLTLFHPVVPGRMNADPQAKYVETPVKAAVPHMAARIGARYVTLLRSFFPRGG